MLNQLMNDMVKESPWTQARLATSMGFNSAQALRKRLDPEVSPQVDFAAALLQRLGYDLAVVPAGAKLPEGSVLLPGDFEPGTRCDAVTEDPEWGGAR